MFIELWPFNIRNWFICSSIRNRIAYANEANIVNKDSPIRIRLGKLPWSELDQWKFVTLILTKVGISEEKIFELKSFCFTLDVVITIRIKFRFIQRPAREQNLSELRRLQWRLVLVLKVYRWPGLFESWLKLSTIEITVSGYRICFVNTYPLHRYLSDW